MYSQCPDCLARFRVTAAALRAAHGTVRCGRCGATFDALETLADSAEETGVHAALADVSGAGAAGYVAGEYQFTAEDLERVFVEARDWPASFSADETRAPATAGVDEPVEQPLVVVDETTEVEDITLEGERLREELPGADRGPEDDLDSTDEFELLGEAPGLREIEDAERTSEQEIEEIFRALPEDAVFDDRTPVSLPPESPAPETGWTAPAAVVATAAAASTVVPAAPSSTVEADGRLATEPSPGLRSWRTENVRTWPDPDAGRIEPMPGIEPDAGTSRWRGVAWALGSLLLALALLAQVVHQNRQSLVRHPTLGGPVRSVYDGLGLPMLPNWNLAGFELRQWGNEPETAADGRMVVRASLRNGADFAQPHPILRLELDDRYGETVATRDFEPAEYLKDSSQASRLIAPGASAEAELILADPGAEAVGYRLDVCLRESPELLRCAQGPG
ncbi:MAG: DUF3426 domain-containing protein [Lysobacterales bacterium]|nr:MAG: DUF3426 domain-containing protein [Xanthomonadales bacterium]